MLTNPSVRKAVRHALIAGAMASAVTAIPASAADDENISEVVVTGSRIRRVDQETANPVLVIDQEAIKASGITTAGDLVQRIPSVSGAATNPAVNNGGGFGESNIELRGLDAKRTLILVDGRRIGLVGASDATDVNQIPVAMIERVEVLKEGAGAVYGSDAIGGVVNFITRKDVDGLEINADYGQSYQHDGQHYSFDATFGTSTDKMNFVLGGSYSEQDAVSAGDRDFSKFALYLYGGTTGAYAGGSSRTPMGRVYLPDGNAFGCGSVTRIDGAAGSAPSDYRCYNGLEDAYNYQPLNLILTPQERVATFAKVNYAINDYVEAYASALLNRTHSGFQIAPLPFDAQVDDVVLSADSIYNPFGIDFGGLSGDNPNFLLRLSALGNRESDTVSDSKVFNGGLKGKLFNTGWEWDMNVTQSRLDQRATISGYLLKAGVQPALGPSFYAADGTPTCGTPTEPISGCVPVNFFNLESDEQIAALKTISADYNTQNNYRYEAYALDLNGKLFDLPAGELLSSIGFEYNKRRGEFTADSIVQAQAPLYLQCQLANETCTGNTMGEYNSRQLYAEFYAPLLKDLPGVYSLAVDVGVRYADYSAFGDATKGDFKLEYRPVRDLLVRGTYSQIFRVPTITDIAASPVNSSITWNDPCTHITAADIAATPNLAAACPGVPLTGDFEQTTSQITGLLLSNTDLKPETGDVKTFGVVWEPQFLSGLSLEVDFWDYHIEDLITTLDASYASDTCVATGVTFCDLMNRYQSGPSAGKILVFSLPTLNLGELDTDGVDFGVKYVLRDTAIGGFQFSIDATHINKYDSTLGDTTQEIAGTYDRQFGNYAKWRAVAQVGWLYNDFSAQVAARFIDSIVMHDPAATGVDENGNPYPDLQIPSKTYIDMSVSYNIAATNTRVGFGVRNVGDTQPPILYQNNVTNANTDVETYDTIGRQYFVQFGQKF